MTEYTAIIISLISLAITLIIYFGSIKRQKEAHSWNRCISKYDTDTDKCIIYKDCYKCETGCIIGFLYELVFYYNNTTNTISLAIVTYNYTQNNNIRNYDRYRIEYLNLNSNYYNILIPNNGYYIYRPYYSITKELGTKIIAYYGFLARTKSKKNESIKRLLLNPFNITNIRNLYKAICLLTYQFTYLIRCKKESGGHAISDTQYILISGSDAYNLNRYIWIGEESYIRIHPNEYSNILDLRLVNDNYIEHYIRWLNGEREFE